MIILALNCGSSSIKYKLFDWKKQKALKSGLIERIGIEGGHPHHEAAINKIITDLPREVSAVGHRVVHGGEWFKDAVLIDEKVLEVIRSLRDLAPLHNPANLAGIEAARKILPKIPQIAVFDTAFHQTLPEYAYLYAVPYEWYPLYGVRRYGFHGTSHYYVSRRAACRLGKDPCEVNLITLHIGNGASVAAVRAGKAIDTSMGLTPLEGLVMGTRCGDVDPGIILFMMEKEGFKIEELDAVLNRKSGLLGITGKFSDRRDIEREASKGDKRCQLARKIEAYRLKKYIGAYLAVLGKVDALVFTGGAGEKDFLLRLRVLESLENLGVKLDEKKNQEAVDSENESIISTEDSRLKILVIPTDEEKILIEEVVKILTHRPADGPPSPSKMKRAESEKRRL